MAGSPSPPCRALAFSEQVDLPEFDLPEFKYQQWTQKKGPENPGSKKRQLDLAKGKLALLASELLLWTCYRAKELRTFVVNWGILAIRALR